MKFTRGLVIVVTFGLSLFSCFSPPEYSLTPEIEFENLVFKDLPDPSDADSLILFIKFRDGDGNLGLSPNDTGCFLVGSDTICYNERTYFVDSNGQFLNYEVKRTNPQFSYLPDYVKPYDCISWELVYDNSQVPQPRDTLYFELNEDHYNIFVDFLVKQNDGTFQEFDWLTEFCTTFDSRLPVLVKNQDLSQQNPLEGTLRYAMNSVGFKLQFSIKTLKLRIQIQDRLLNKSNIIETPEFQFN